MKQHTPFFRSIGFSLFRHAFGSYVVIAILITAFQAWDEYKVTRSQNIQHLQDTARMLHNGLANAAWHVDKPMLDDLMQGVLTSSVVRGIRIMDEANQLMAEQGDLLPVPDSSLMHVFELSDPTGLSADIIASVELHSSRDVIFAALNPTLQSLVVAALLKTIALWVIFLYFGNRLLGLPLNRMARDLDARRIRDLASHLEPEQMNEIEKLGVAILNLQASSERRLTRSEHRLQQILDAAGEGMLVLDEAGLISYSNPAASALLGWETSEMKGADPASLFGRHQPGVERGCEIQKVLESGHAIERFDATFYRKDGSSFPASFKSCPIMDSDRVSGVVAMFQDVSAQRQQESVLRQSRNTYQTLLNNLPEQVVYKTTELVCISANRSFAESVGRQANEIPGLHLSALLPKEQARKIEMADWQAISSGASVEFEDRVQHMDEERIMQTISSPVFDRKNEVIGVMSIIWDITQLKQAEKERQRMEVQLHQAQKLESVGQLAAGIAHEINTPVQFVSDNTTFIRDAFKDIDALIADYRELLETPPEALDPAARMSQVAKIEQDADLEFLREEIPKAIDQSMGGLQRIAKIVLAMKEFSHPGSDEKTPTDINRAIQSTIDVSRNEWKYDSELVTDFDPNLPMVPVLPGEFNQVILNLIVNAAHAIHALHREDHSGRIEITTRLSGEQVEIRISDNGCGIPASIRKRIYDPFFTTKEVGKGTGQGLAIAYSAIVDKHDGSIDLQSEENVGTTFIIRLPLKPADAVTGVPA
jgi:two-component system NtrC family sensor kinase